MQRRLMDFLAEHPELVDSVFEHPERWIYGTAAAFWALVAGGFLGGFFYAK